MKKYNPKDFRWPIIFSLSAGISTYLLSKKLCLPDFNDLSEKIVDIVINFGLTFLAFTLTAFALIQLLTLKNWFNQLCGTDNFRTFLNNFLLAAFVNMIIFFIGLGFKICSMFLPNHLRILILAFSITAVVFSCLWLWQCIRTLVELFKKKDIQK